MSVHHEVAPRVAHQPFDLAVVVALARSSEAIGEQVVRLQLAEIRVLNRLSSPRMRVTASLRLPYTVGRATL